MVNGTQKTEKQMIQDEAAKRGLTFTEKTTIKTLDVMITAYDENKKAETEEVDNEIDDVDSSIDDDIEEEIAPEDAITPAKEVVVESKGIKFFEGHPLNKSNILPGNQLVVQWVNGSINPSPINYTPEGGSKTIQMFPTLAEDIYIPTTGQHVKGFFFRIPADNTSINIFLDAASGKTVINKVTKKEEKIPYKIHSNFHVLTNKEYDSEIISELRRADVEKRKEEKKHLKLMSRG